MYDMEWDCAVWMASQTSGEKRLPFFARPRCDQKWCCRQKLCTKSGGGKNNKKNQLLHQLNNSASSLSPSPALLLHTSRGKWATKRENRTKKQFQTSFCNNTNKPQLYSSETRLCASCRQTLWLDYSGVQNVVLTLHNMNLLFSWSVECCCFWCPLSDAFLGWPFSFQANTVQLQRSSFSEAPVWRI